MKWTIRQNGKKVVKEVFAAASIHGNGTILIPPANPPCRTERCNRRNARKGK